MMTERKRQHHKAVEVASSEHGNVWRYHFDCDDGETFSAIAPSESGAFRVLNAERPGIGARFDGVSFCPIETRAAQLAYREKIAWGY